MQSTSRDFSRELHFCGLYVSYFSQGPVVHSHNQGRYTHISVEHTLCVCSNTVRFGPIRLNILRIAG